MRVHSRMAMRFIVIVFLLSTLTAGCTLPICTRSEYVVTRVDDPAGGACTVESCSLRQAVTASNLCSGVQNIRIPAGTYTLSLAGRNEDVNGRGDLDITDGTTIIGVGAPVIDGGGIDRVMQVHSGRTAVLFGLILQNGHSTSRVSEDVESGGDADGSGGGLRNDGTTYLLYSIVRNNSTAPSGWGGGIFNDGLLMQITQSIIEGNTASSGGGILNRGRYFTMTYSTIQGNYAGGLGYGGGLHNDFGASAAIVSESAIINNDTNGVSSTGDGVSNAGQLRLQNVTISGNEGDGVESVSGTVEVFFSTVVNNGRYGIVGPPANSHIGNSILEGNWQNCSGGGTLPASNGYNISSDATCAFSSPGDLNSLASQIGPLASNGGPTMTHVLNAGSPALDSVNSAECPGIDQRSVARPQGTGCDRGAYERNVTASTEAVEATVPTPTPTLTAVPTTASSDVILTVEVPANCRQGPDVGYPVVTSVQAGQKVQIVGRNEQSSWWYAKVAGEECWISVVAGTPQGNIDQLPVKQAPPLPTPTTVPATPTPVPTETAVVILDPDYDGDGYPASVDCNDKDPKVNPAALEDPQDGIDNNCNGDLFK